MNVSRIDTWPRRRKQQGGSGLRKGPKRDSAHPPSPSPLALLTAHCPTRQELGGIPSSFCGRGLDFGAGTGTRIRAQPLPERARVGVRLELVPAGAPSMARSARALGARTISPTPASPTDRGLLSILRWGCPGTTALKPGMHPPSWEPSLTQARVSKVAAWGPTKGSASPLSRRSRNSAACSRTWMLLATDSMSATAGGGRA